MQEKMPKKRSKCCHVDQKIIISTEYETESEEIKIINIESNIHR